MRPLPSVCYLFDRIHELRSAGLRNPAQVVLELLLRHTHARVLNDQGVTVLQWQHTASREEFICDDGQGWALFHGFVIRIRGTSRTPESKVGLGRHKRTREEKLALS